jgi:hypothetical protein
MGRVHAKMNKLSIVEMTSCKQSIEQSLIDVWDNHCTAISKALIIKDLT